MRSTASGRHRKKPATGSRISASASSRENGASSTSSKKLYQGLTSLFQRRLIPTPLITATRFSEKLFMKTPRRRWLTLSEYELSTSTSSISSASFTLRGVRVLSSAITRCRSWLKSRAS